MPKHKKNKRGQKEEVQVLRERLESMEKTLKELSRNNPPAKKRKRRTSSSSSSSSSYQSSSSSSESSKSQSDTNPPRPQIVVPQIAGPSADQENQDSNVSFEKLDQEVLDLIGERLTEEKKFDEPIHQDVADRWLDILKQGLPEEMRLEILKKYPVPQNCVAIDPPKLNSEVRSVLGEAIKKRDDRILVKQAKIAAALAALSKVMSAQLKSKDKSLLGYVNDAARLLADIQRDESVIRRALVIANFNNPAAKEVLTATVTSEWLFGTDLAEKFKAAKALEVPLKKLQPTLKTQTSKPATNSKNMKVPSKRPSGNRSSQGGKNYRTSSSKDGRRSPSRKRSPHRQTNSRRH